MVLAKLVFRMEPRSHYYVHSFIALREKRVSIGDFTETINAKNMLKPTDVGYVKVSRKAHKCQNIVVGKSFSLFFFMTKESNLNKVRFFHKKVSCFEGFLQEMN